MLVARHARRFANGEAGYDARDLDWTDPSFHDRLTQAVRAGPPVGRALLWLHRMEADLLAVLPLLDGARIVLVLGSTDGHPADVGGRGIVTVRLGRMPSRNGRRWLSHEEISAGAIAALQDGRSRIVGELRPLR